MSRFVRFVLVATVIFLLFFFTARLLFLTDEIESTEVAEPSVDVYVLESSVEKKQAVHSNLLTVKRLQMSKLRGLPYSPVQDFNLSAATLFTRDVPKGSYLTTQDVINPDHDDYILLALNDGELPYWYDVSELINNKALTVKSGDFVSFALVPQNTSMTSKLIVKQARVLKLVESTTFNKKAGPSSFRLVLALNVKDILKLEKARQSRNEVLTLVLTTNIKKRDDSEIVVYALNRQVVKGQIVKQDDLVIRTVRLENLEQDYTEIDEFELLPGAVYKGDYVDGTIMARNMVANKSDNDYPLQFLKKNELPYWIDVTTLLDKGALVVKQDDLVSLVLRVTSNKPQSQGFGSVTSKVIADQIRVLHLTTHQSSQGEITHNLVVALDSSQVLKLETAKKAGELIVVLSSNLSKEGEVKGSFSSSNFNDKRPFRIKTLRGGQ